MLLRVYVAISVSLYECMLLRVYVVKRVCLLLLRMFVAKSVCC